MKRSFIPVLLLAALTACQSLAENPQREATKLRLTEGKALFEEKCRTVAGERIYKTVPEVEGVLLLKVRRDSGDKYWSDLMWPGAAFAREATGDQYITNFLAPEMAQAEARGGPRSITKEKRGLVTTVPPERLTPADRPGYRWVEVVDEKDGMRYRYTGSEKVVGKKDTSAYNVQLALSKNPNYDLNVYQWSLDKVPATGVSPRYGVTFEDHVIPEERRLGLASSTVKVLDLQTGEVLGEMLRYAWSPGAPSRANPSPWLTAYRCPDLSFNTGSATRKFVDQILIPKKGQ